MAADHGSELAMSFGSIAEDYNRFRPGPPPEAVEWALAGRHGLVVEIGAGTGGLTRQLVARVDGVVAVEPDPRMGGVLLAEVPGVPVIVGRAEELALKAGCADAVVGSSMWHWVDPDRGPLEVARVLRPGGMMGLMWSGPDRSQGWLAELMAGPGADQATLSLQAAHRKRRHEVALPPEAPFGEPERHTFRWQLTVTAEELIGLASTYSAFIALPEPDRSRLRADLADFVNRHELLAGREEIDLPMRCHCWRAVRLAPALG